LTGLFSGTSFSAGVCCGKTLFPRPEGSDYRIGDSSGNPLLATTSFPENPNYRITI